MATTTATTTSAGQQAYRISDGAVREALRNTGHFAGKLMIAACERGMGYAAMTASLAEIVVFLETHLAKGA